MTKKELEEQMHNLQEDYKYLEEHLRLGSNRVEENIRLIETNLKQEKNKDKQKLLGGLLNEFQYIKNILDLNDLPF